MIIDFHCHVFPDGLAQKASDNLARYYGVPMPFAGTVKELTQDVSETGVEKCVIHSTATKASQVESINNFIAALNGGAFLGFGTLHPDFDSVLKEAGRMKALGLHGIKLHPDFQGFYVDSDKALRLFEAAQKCGLPVLVHLGDEKETFSSPRRMARVLARFPDLTVIGAHMGGYMRWDEAQEYLYGTNIYFDTSSTMRVIGPEKMAELIRRHGADKVVFGTDFPMESHRTCLAQLEQLGLSDEEKDKVLFQNAAKILKISLPKKEEAPC